MADVEIIAGPGITIVRDDQVVTIAASDSLLYRLLGENVLLGDVVRDSPSNTIKARAISGQFDGVLGAAMTNGNTSDTIAIITEGPAVLRGIAGLVLQTGDPLYLSSSISGLVTNIPPTISIQIGHVVDGSSYTGTSGDPITSQIRLSTLAVVSGAPLESLTLG